MRKKIFLLLSTLMLLCALSSCQTTNSSAVTPTGYASDEIDQPQIMYNNIIFYYWATGFDGELPDDYIYIGEVEEIDNKEQPSKNYSGSRLEVSQKIYTNGEKPEIIYIKYENGYARFSSSYIECFHLATQT